MSTRVNAPVLALAAMCLMLVVAGGCSSTQKRTYEITVQNQSNLPVTVWLTKDGPVYENNWKSPEDLAIETRWAGEPIAGVVIPPGKTAGVGPISGQFAPQTHAILRVYLGQHNFSELLAMGRNAPDRRDYELQEGHNGFRIVDHDGRLLVETGDKLMSTSADAPAK